MELTMSMLLTWEIINTKQAQTMAGVQSVVLIDRQDVEEFLLDVKEGTKHSKIFNLEKIPLLCYN